VRSLITVLLIGGASALAQNRGLIAPQRVSPAMMYHRVWAVTPLVGSPGKPDDPVRPNVHRGGRSPLAVQRINSYWFQLIQPGAFIGSLRAEGGELWRCEHVLWRTRQLR
jgi:hypothetical protein